MNQIRVSNECQRKDKTSNLYNAKGIITGLIIASNGCVARYRKRYVLLMGRKL